MVATPLREDLEARMRAALEPGQVARFEQVWPAYDGRLDLLAEFLDLAKTDNPFRAREQTKIVSYRFRRASEKTEDEILGISMSGHQLRREIFTLEFSDSQLRALGTQGLMKLTQAFGTSEQAERFSSGSEREIDHQRYVPTSLAQDGFVTSFGQVLASPSLLANVYSSHDKAQLRKLLELVTTLAASGAQIPDLEELAREGKSISDLRLPGLQDAIKRVGTELRTLFVGKGLSQPSYRTAADVGGTMYTWFARNLDDLPIRVRDAFTRSSHPAVEVDEETERKDHAILTAYFATKSPYAAKATLHHDVQDMQFLVGLPKGDSVIQKYGYPRDPDLVTILEKAEVNAADILTVRMSYDFRLVRGELNTQHYNEQAFAGTRKEEVEGVLSKLEALFIEDGSWRDDALGSSVPLDRLKQTYAGLVLNRNEFKAVMDMLRMHSLSLADEQEMLATFGIVDFRQRVEYLTLVARKISYLESRMEKGKLKRAVTASAEEEIPHLEGIRGKGYTIEVLEHKFGLSIQKIIDRGNDLYNNDQERKKWETFRLKLKGIKRYGICPEKTYKKLEKRIKKIQGMFLAQDYTPEINALRNRELYDNPLVLHLEVVAPRDDVYLQAEWREELHIVREVRAALATADEQTLENLTRSRDIEGASLYDVVDGEIQRTTYETPTKELGEARHVRRPMYSPARFASGWDGPRQLSFARAMYIDPEDLAAKLEDLDTNWVQREDVNIAFFDQVRYLLGEEGERAIESEGMGLLDRKLTHVFSADYISTRLIEYVGNLHDQLTKAA